MMLTNAFFYVSCLDANMILFRAGGIALIFFSLPFVF